MYKVYFTYVSKSIYFCITTLVYHRNLMMQFWVCRRAIMQACKHSQQQSFSLRCALSQLSSAPCLVNSTTWSQHDLLSHSCENWLQHPPYINLVREMLAGNINLFFHESWLFGEMDELQLDEIQLQYQNIMVCLLKWKWSIVIFLSRFCQKNVMIKVNSESILFLENL